MSDVAIRVENLSKRYRIGVQEERQDTLVGAMLAFVKRPGRNLQRLRRLTRFSANGLEEKDVIWALRDVSFEVKQGEVVGVIGRNGAGKSTLLKVLSRITYPTTGRIELHGRVSSLLEVGTGFHPELTGRENVYLNGTILGMRKKEIDRKFDEIVDFSGVEKFIDTPVKYYSSGMRVRLAFSVAAHLEPEILLVDEVLAVGDVEFQKKCLGKMGDVASKGRTVLFVSHNMGAVSQLCPRTIWVQKGHIAQNDSTEKVISTYLSSGASLEGMRVWRDGIANEGIEDFKLYAIRIIDQYGEVSATLDAKRPFLIELKYEICKTLPYCRVGVVIDSIQGTTIFEAYDADDERYTGVREPGVFTSVCEVPGNLLSPGQYIISFNAGVPRVRNLVSVENVLTINVENIGAVGSHMLNNRRGIIRPRLLWRRESVSN